MAEKNIYQDGKNYKFNPGKNGSLTAPAPQQQTGFDLNRPSVSKVIPILRDMRRKKTASTQIGAVRG